MLRTIRLITLSLLLSCAVGAGSALAGASCLYDFEGTSIDGTKVRFSDFRGKVILIANTSLKCATAVQFGDLQKVYEKYQDRGLVVFGFPSNDFTGVEPKDPQEVKKTCTKKFGVTFPLFAQTYVKGEKTCGLYNFLTSTAPEEMQGPVMFNFEKFLIGRDGQVRARFGSFTNATSSVFTEELEKLLDEEAQS